MKAKVVNYKEYLKTHRPVWAAFCGRADCDDYAARWNRTTRSESMEDPFKGIVSRQHELHGWMWCSPEEAEVRSRFANDPNNDPWGTYTWAVIMEEAQNELGEVCP